jgi:4-amino-4-deoxy-L-arabinose transferase-like glycosyltransferase
MKMNHGFMRQYDIYNYSMVPRKEEGLVDYVWETDPNIWNSRRIRTVYHRPLHLQPPLFPTMIWISHGIFNRSMPYTSVDKSNAWSIFSHPPWHFMRAQFYALIIPFFFSVLLLALVYLFCLHYFSYKEGLLALLILITSPLDFAVSSKLYADGILTTLTFLSLSLYIRSLEKGTKHPMVMAILAGFALGLSYLTKTTGILFAFGFIIVTFVWPEHNRGFLKRLFDRRLLIAGLVTFLMTLPWNYLILKTYGYFPSPTPYDPTNPWNQYVFGRSPLAYPLGTIWLVPPLIVGWIYGVLRIFKPRINYLESTLFVTSAFYVLMFLIFQKTGAAGIEERYLLPIYPLLIILSARGLIQILNQIKKSWLQNMGYAFVIVGLVILGWRSSMVGLNASFRSLTVFSPFGL